MPPMATRQGSSVTAEPISPSAPALGHRLGSYAIHGPSGAGGGAGGVIQPMFEEDEEEQPLLQHDNEQEGWGSWFGRGISNAASAVSGGVRNTLNAVTGPTAGYGATSARGFGGFLSSATRLMGQTATSLGRGVTTAGSALSGIGSGVMAASGLRTLYDTGLGRAQEARERMGWGEWAGRMGGALGRMSPREVYDVGLGTEIPARERMDWLPWMRDVGIGGAQVAGGTAGLMASLGTGGTAAPFVSTAGTVAAQGLGAFRNQPATRGTLSGVSGVHLGSQLAAPLIGETASQAIDTGSTFLQSAIAGGAAGANPFRGGQQNAIRRREGYEEIPDPDSSESGSESGYEADEELV